jgi:hypothetical protein
MGPDADDPALDLDTWRARIRRHPGELKNLLRNQEFVAGIGNAYSDEILHAARLQPFRKRGTLAPEEIDELYAATRATLTNAVSSCASASRPPSRLRSATSWPSTTAAASHARGAAIASRRPRPAASSRATAATASADHGPDRWLCGPRPQTAADPDGS